MKRPRLRPLLPELDPTSFPAFRDRILEAEADAPSHAVRRYPGFPRVELPRPRHRRLPRFDDVVTRRRTCRAFEPRLPDAKALSAWLELGHGVTGPDGRGPTPSAGNLQAVQLVLVPLCSGWLGAGAYHYDRGQHGLARIGDGAPDWNEVVPSLSQAPGAPLLVVIAGEETAVAHKYGERGLRFLLLEAGQVLQSLGMAAAAGGLAVTPMGGFFEGQVHAHTGLGADDLVLATAVAGIPARP
ncbi:MAG: nitroreductase family protein [Myxococcota bacterium]